MLERVDGASRMSRPIPTPVLHFTHVSHLATIVQHGLLSDTQARARGVLAVEIGNASIKKDRRGRSVPVGPGGCVADYVPFYFAPRSPMMYAIEKGKVPTYDGGCDDLVYLMSDVQRLRAEGLLVLATDRNAVLGHAEFTEDDARLTDIVDWDLMQAAFWATTPDGRERRMAECLVHEAVPRAAFTEVACKNDACAARARSALATVGSRTTVAVRPDWYF
jgi:ssDNA thymidine ADP-ribosyltransferase, DarT